MSGVVLLRAAVLGRHDAGLTQEHVAVLDVAGQQLALARDAHHLGHLPRDEQHAPDRGTHGQRQEREPGVEVPPVTGSSHYRASGAV